MPTRRPPLLLAGPLALALAGLLAGCSADSSAAPVGRAYPPRDKAHRVDVYVDPAASGELLEGFGLTYPPDQLPPNAAFIGRVDAHGPVKWRAVADEARTRARDLGGDALVIGDTRQAVRSDYGGFRGEERYFRSLAAVVYRYATPESSPGYDPRDDDASLRR